LDLSKTTFTFAFSNATVARPSLLSKAFPKVCWSSRSLIGKIHANLLPCEEYDSKKLLKAFKKV
jgi:hypothetical protein